MGKGAPINKLKAWRLAHGYSMEEAGKRIVVDGEPSSKAAWHSWENGKKIPKEPWVIALCATIDGLEPNDFYARFDGGANSGGSADGGSKGNGGKPTPKAGNGTPPQLALAI